MKPISEGSVCFAPRDDKRTTNATKVCSLAAIPEERDEIREPVEINVRGIGGAVVRAEAIIYGGGQSAGVAGGLHVNFGIADQDGFGGGGAEFAKNRPCAEGVGFFCFKAVAAIDG